MNNLAALAFAMREGLIYVNVHTTENAPGEFRGQLRMHPVVTPDDDEEADDEDTDDHTPPRRTPAGGAR